MPQHLIGCSGWSYPWWKGRFYPEGLPAKEQLSYYSRQFRTVEVNMTFYRFPTSRAVRGWYEATPPGFLFAVKMNRTITHYRKLRGVERLVRSFMELLEGLENKLGPILIQLPPGLPPDLDLLEQFFSLLPPHPYAVEFRDRRWQQPSTYRLLERLEAAAVNTDPPPPADLRATASFAYVRWHGRTGPGYEYTRAQLAEWHDTLEDLGVDRIYGYFNNDQGGAATRNAALMTKLMERGEEAAPIRMTRLR